MGILYKTVEVSQELKRQHMIQQLIGMGITEDDGDAGARIGLLFGKAFAYDGQDQKRMRGMIMVQVGDWVKVKLFGYYLVGFVEYIWDDTVQITKVLRVSDGELERISQRSGIYDVSQMEPLPSDIHPEDLSVLIDMALDHYDRQWFEELTRRRKYESSKTV
mgnify:CR=1 FL=1